MTNQKSEDDQPESVTGFIGSTRSTGSCSDEVLVGSSMYDIVVCGGTLGVFIAAALQLRGQKVSHA